jgi:hypothetical protein
MSTDILQRHKAIWEEDNEKRTVDFKGYQQAKKEDRYEQGQINQFWTNDDELDQDDERISCYEQKQINEIVNEITKKDPELVEYLRPKIDGSYFEYDDYWDKEAEWIEQEKEKYEEF